MSRFQLSTIRPSRRRVPLGSDSAIPLDLTRTLRPFCTPPAPPPATLLHAARAAPALTCRAPPAALLSLPRRPPLPPAFLPFSPAKRDAAGPSRTASGSPGTVVAGSLRARHLVAAAAGAEEARRALRPLRRRGPAGADVPRRRLARRRGGGASGAVGALRARRAERGGGALRAVAPRGGDARQLVGRAGCGAARGFSNVGARGAGLAAPAAQSSRRY